MATNANAADLLNPAMAATTPTGVDDERLAEIKLQILNGTYLNEARLNGACEALFGVLTQSKKATTTQEQKKTKKQLCGC